MGFGGISIWQLVIVLGIIILIFGTKKLRNLGGDVGSAVKGFKKAMNDDSADAEQKKISAEEGDAEFKKDDVAAKTSENSESK